MSENDTNVFGGLKWSKKLYNLKNIQLYLAIN